MVLGIKAASVDGKLGEECYSDPILVKWNLAFYDEFDYSAKDGNDPQFTAKWKSENGKRTEEYGRYPKNLEVKDGYVYCTVGKPDGTEPGYVNTMKYTAGSFSAYDRENDTLAVGITFTDQDQISSWALDSVQKAVALGLLKGMGDGFFAPVDSATRAQSAVVIYRLL